MWIDALGVAARGHPLYTPVACGISETSTSRCINSTMKASRVTTGLHARARRWNISVLHELLALLLASPDDMDST